MRAPQCPSTCSSVRVPRCSPGHGHLGGVLAGDAYVLLYLRCAHLEGMRSSAALLVALLGCAHARDVHALLGMGRARVGGACSPAQ